MSKMSQFIIPCTLGILEGITEFLPISSTGHIILIKHVLDYIDGSIQIFLVIIQLGAISAVLVIFKNRLYKISIGYVFECFIKKNCVCNSLKIQHIFIGSLPGVIVGWLFYEKIKLFFFEPIHIVYGLVLGSILLLISEWYFSVSSSSYISSVDRISYYQAFLIGCFQCLAFWPGFSRFGSTIGGGLLMGLNRKAASEFSLFLAIPIILGSAVLTIYRQRYDVDILNVVIISIIGFLSAFITALITINFFLKTVQKISLVPFAIYRFVLAIIIYYCIHAD